jgi:hypothetical protein
MGGLVKNLLLLSSAMLAFPATALANEPDTESRDTILVMDDILIHAPCGTRASV